MLSNGETYAAPSDPDRSLEALLHRGATRRYGYVLVRTRGCMLRIRAILEAGITA